MTMRDEACQTGENDVRLEENGSAVTPGRDGEPELDRCRRALTEAQDELRRARDHLVLFAAQVSHDLRTPLTAILANAEMLAAEPALREDGDLAWMLAAVQRGALRMDAMIEQLVAYAREGGDPVLADTPLGEVFRQAAEDLGHVVAEKHAEVTVGPLPTLSADAGQLRAVAGAVLSNALRFSRPDVTPRVVVGADLRGDCWRVAVTDNGIGVPPERRDEMFVLFARGDKRIEGDGVGLATAKRLVEAHGGRIGMDDAPGGGTTVWFELPV